MPQRIQLRRTAGWRLPENARSVARPHKWGNPYRVGVDGTAAECVRLYEASLTPEQQRQAREELAGRDLACFCPIGAPCHADVLLRIANEEVQGAG